MLSFLPVGRQAKARRGAVRYVFKIIFLPIPPTKMKTIRFILIAIIILFLGMTSTLWAEEDRGWWLPSPDELKINENQKLQRIIYFGPSRELSDKWSGHEYAYENDRLIKATRYHGGEIISYDVYEYNEEGHLATKTNFHANQKSEAGFIILKIFTYVYENNLLVKEFIEYPQLREDLQIDVTLKKKDQSSSKQNFLIKGEDVFDYMVYTYDKENRLSKKERFSDEGKSTFLVEYTYDESGKWIKAQTGWGPHVIHTYEKDRFAKSTVSLNDEAIREVKYHYEDNGVVIESKELSMASSLMGGFVKYEYSSD